MPASEIDMLRAGVSREQLRRELSISRYADADRSASWRFRLEEAKTDRLGRPLAVEEPDLDDAGKLGAMLGISERPVLRTSLVRSLGWSLDRVDEAARELSRRLPKVGMGLFEYLDESLQIGALAEDLDWEQSQRDVLAQHGVTYEEATLIRHLVRRDLRIPDNFQDRPRAVRGALKASLIRETSNRLELNVKMFDAYTIGRVTGCASDAVE